MAGPARVRVITVTVQFVLLAAAWLWFSRERRVPVTAGGWSFFVVAPVVLVLGTAVVALATPANRERAFVALTLVITGVLVLLVFSRLYYAYGTPEHFGAELSHGDALYMALGTMTTAGTGTLAPHDALARTITSVQMSVDLAFLTVIVGVGLTLFSPKRR
jgi:hypothetical protein